MLSNDNVTKLHFVAPSEVTFTHFVKSRSLCLSRGMVGLGQEK